MRPVAVDAGLLVEELLDKSSVREDDAGAGTEFEREDAAVFLGPFCESVLVR